LPVVAARLLALRKPAGAVEALLAYVACTEDETMRGEVAGALRRLAGTGGKGDPVLVKALQDAAPVRRAIAGEVLAGTADVEVRAGVRKLLADPDLEVRLRVAVALGCAADKEAVPALIDLLADAPGDQWWRAEEILVGLEGAKVPPPAAGDDLAARQKCRDAWRAWYTDHGARARLSPRPVPPPLLGFTTIAALSLPPDRTKSRVFDVDRQGKVRWQFECHYPVDVRVLPGSRVLVSEFEAKRITERDFKGNILWQKTALPGPMNIQRLPNGNTFVVCRMHLMEFDVVGKTVFDRPFDELLAGSKLPDGRIVYLTPNGKCVHLDAAGKEVKRFESGQTREQGCVLDLTPRGSLLVSMSFKNAAAEFDLEGNKLWHAEGADLAGIATEVRNGHKIVALTYQSMVVELNRAGKVVWQYQTPGYEPFLARQR
jgi:hypothetical protein